VSAVKAMVLCAGLGTRLRPLTERWPKPALPLLGQPLFRYTLAALKRAGVAEVAINTHHLPKEMEQTAGAEAARAEISLRVFHEPVIQGTGGGIRGARAFLAGDPFVVWNGDILFALDLQAVLAEHRASGAVATMVLIPMPAGETYASVEVDPAGRVVRIAGRGPGAAGASPWHFTGVHVMSPAAFDFMSPSGEEDINRVVYPKMMAQGLLVRAAKVQAYWSDLGTPARYLATQRDLLAGQVPLDAFPGASPFEGTTRQGNAWWREPGSAPTRAIAGPAFIDRGALLEAGVQIGGSVYVGERARVGQGARLNRAAVLEGAQVNPGEELVDAIAWGDRRLRVGEGARGPLWPPPT